MKSILIVLSVFLLFTSSTVEVGGEKTAENVGDPGIAREAAEDMDDLRDAMEMLENIDSFGTLRELLEEYENTERQGCAEPSQACKNPTRSCCESSTGRTRVCKCNVTGTICKCTRAISEIIAGWGK